MTRQPITEKPSRFRALIASFLVCSIAFAIGLSAAPQLHDSLHKGDRTTHECAATLLSSGSWEHSAPEPAFTDPKHAPAVRILEECATPKLAAALEFARLEHAPPAVS
jgi:hypothetical protein